MTTAAGPDDSARRAIRERLDATMLVEAGAGTGAGAGAAVSGITTTGGPDEPPPATTVITW